VEVWGGRLFGRGGEVGKGRAIAFSFKLAVTKELLVSIRHQRLKSIGTVLENPAWVSASSCQLADFSNNSFGPIDLLGSMARYALLSKIGRSSVAGMFLVGW
tara:strand:- start:1647 stop:1952 length:306 start_codon:yes stop_codon:yes gene_type:complete